MGIQISPPPPEAEKTGDQQYEMELGEMFVGKREYRIMQIAGFLGMCAAPMLWMYSAVSPYAALVIMLAFFALLVAATRQQDDSRWVKIAIGCGAIIFVPLLIFAWIFFTIWLSLYLKYSQ